jgi:hypothetical protein
MRIRKLGLQSRSLGIGLAGLAALAAEGVLTQPAMAAAGDVEAWVSNKTYPPTQFSAVVPDVYPGTNNGINIAVGDANNTGVPVIVTGNGPGSPDTIDTLNYSKISGFGSPQAYFTPDTAQYGVRVAVGEWVKDGMETGVYSAASGASSLIGLTWLKSGYTATAYSYPQTNGVYVAAGDLLGDGQDEVITGPSTGDPTSGTTQSPVVNVYSAASGSIAQLGSFTPLDSTYTGGVRVATGDVDGSGVDSIICGPDQGTNPTLEAYTWAKITGGYSETIKSKLTVDSYGSSQGVYIATGDVTGSGEDDLIIGAGPGGLPYVTVYTYNTSSSSWAFDYDFLAYPASYTGGVEVAVGDLNGDGVEDIITSPAGAISVPEPASLSLLVAGGALLSCRRRKRRDRLLSAGG